MTLSHFSKGLIRPVSGGQFSKQKRSASLNTKLKTPDSVEVYQRGGDGEEAAVEAVEEASVARKDIAAVLDAQLTLDLTLYKVAPCAKDGNNKTKAHPLNESERGFVARNYRSYRHGKQSTANAAYP